jgi:hypothetical protein
MIWTRTPLDGASVFGLLASNVFATLGMVELNIQA